MVIADDIATPIVASYAAVVATFGLGFQVFSWLRSWQTRVSLRLWLGERHQAGAPTERDLVFFTMVNHSPHPVKITHVGFPPIEPGGKGIVIPRPLPVEQPLPIDIAPRDSVTVYITAEELGRAATSRPRSGHRSRPLTGAPSNRRRRGWTNRRLLRKASTTTKEHGS